MGLAKTPAKIANMIFLTPFISFFLIYHVLDEKIHISTIAGLLLIIIGIVIERTAPKSVGKV